MCALQIDSLPTLTISVSRREAGGYAVELAFTRPSTAADAPTVEGIAELDAEVLRQAGDDPKAYGARLARGLLADKEVSDFFNQSLTITRSSGLPYRLRLRIHDNAPELHAWRWETLCHPRTGDFLASDANLRWSREIFSPDWDEIVLRPKGELRVLVAVANPADLKKGVRLLDQTLAEVDVAGELERARASLTGVGLIDELTSPENGPWQVRLENLAARLRQGYDILYLVCHGALLPEDPFDPESPKKPYLLLELPDGRRDRVDGEALVKQVAGLDAARRPRLVVLASCQSGGKGEIVDPETVTSGDRGALAALGPKLAEAGVPAVIAMQGDVKMVTVEKFMPVFFQELVKDGQLERAMALGRSAAIAADRDDWWAPTLYTRLKEGQLFSSLTVGGSPLIAYLTMTSQRPSFPSTLDPSLEVLWTTVRYRARISGQTSGPPVVLFDLIKSLFPIDARGRYQHAVLLGSAGQGKTTALKWLLASYASESLEKLKAGTGQQDHSDLTIPIYVSMNDLRNATQLDRLALKETNDRLEKLGASPIGREQLNEWCKKHRLLFLIDDLEALITGRHGIGVEALTQFMSEPPFRDQSYVIACRSSSYQNQMGTVDLLELADLDLEEVETVLGKERLALFSPQIRKLAQNRSMLHLMLDAKDQKFRTKGQLMKIWVERQLGLNVEGVEGIDSYLATLILQRLAFEMRRSHSLVYDENLVIDLVNKYLEIRYEKYHWRDVLDYLRKKALWLDPVRRNYSFFERAFGDYFSAAAAAADPALRKVVVDSVSDYWWRDTLEILVGLEEEPSELMYEIIDRDAIVAALCIQSAPIEQESPVYAALTDGLVEQMDQKSSAHRKQIVDRIIQSQHPRVPEVLLRRLHREWSSMVIQSIARGLEQWKQIPGKIKEMIATEAAVLAAFPQELETYKEWLQIKTPVCRDPENCDEYEQSRTELEKLDKILNNSRRPAKMRGLAAISLGFSRYRQAGFKLIELLQMPKIDDLVAWCTVEALAEFPDPEVRGRTYELLQQYGSPQFMNKPPRQRARYIYLLGWMNTEACTWETASYRESPSHTVLLKALADDDALVRSCAIHAIVRLNFQGVLGIVEKILGNETEPVVLRSAAEALAQIGTRDTIKALESKLKVDVVQINQNLRSTYRNAIQAIQERYGI